MQEKRNLTEYAIVLNEKDNVATALVDIPEGDYPVAGCGPPRTITVMQRIKAGFKVALMHLHPGDKVYKYGHVIGVAREEIRPGERVHIHNMASSHSFRGGEGK
jgi:hypothetical protein